MFLCNFTLSYEEEGEKKEEKKKEKKKEAKEEKMNKFDADLKKIKIFLCLLLL